MHQYPLLATKLHIPPTRPELVSRPRLLEQLNALLPARRTFSRVMTLISAPAGFGKTTLLSEWVSTLHRDAPQDGQFDSRQSRIVNRVAWLSLDEGDNDPARFLAYLIAALRGIKPSLGERMLSALLSPQPPAAEAVLTSLINEVTAVPDRIILVLDDYHLIEAQTINTALTFLLENLPLQMHLVIATREDPLLPLARLRARGRLTELRATDLRFSTSEAAEFLNRVMGLGLSAQDIAALEDRTEGWIAGLQLAAISLQGRKDTSSPIKSFTGSHRYVLDYLIEEVLEQQSESIQTFLLQTSVLDRLSGSLCEAITGQDSGQANLELLDRANLFVTPLDEERRWYRYHRLFADLLRRQLRQTQPEGIPTLHDRASEWYEQNGFVDEAIAHALHAQDFERAAILIERVAEAVWVRGDDTKLRRWLDRLPPKSMFARPQLCIFHAWSLFATGQQDAAEPCLQAAEQALEPNIGRAAETATAERDLRSDSDRRQLRGRLATTRAFFAFYRGDAPAISHYARRALEYLPQQDLAWRSAAINVLGDAYDFQGEMAAAYQARLEAVEASTAAGNMYQIMISHGKLAIILRQQGWLQRAAEICRQQTQMAHEREMSQTVVAGWMLAIWGEILAELNDLDGAMDQAEEGVALAERGGEVAMLGSSYLNLTRVLFSRGETTGAQEIVQRAENAARKYDMPPWLTIPMAAWQARIWLAENNLDAATQWAQERRLDGAGALAYLYEAEHMMLARILVAQGRLGEATTLLQRLLKAAEAGGRISRAIEILVLRALALQAGGDTVQAMPELERALSLAEPGGFIGTFVDEGAPMAPLLHLAVDQGASPDYAGRLLAAFPDWAAISATRPELVESLSDREHEVLQLIAEGLTNQEIASRLYLSLNTVKAHNRNIFGKLSVHNRTRAIARSQELGLLPRNQA